MKKSYKTVTLDNMQRSIKQSVQLLTSAGVLWAGSYYILHNSMSIGQLIMSLQELIQQVKKRLPLRVAVSREQLLPSAPNWCLSMTLLNPLHPLITRTYDVRWNRRGLMSLHLLCSKGHGLSALGPDFTLTTYTPLYLSQRIIGNKSSKKQS